MRFKLAVVVAFRNWVVVGALLLVAHAAQAADVTPHDVMALGDSNHFWIARVEQIPKYPKSIHTNIYYRLLGEENTWRTLTPESLPARVVSLASQNSLPAALLDDGSWMLLYPDSPPFSAGPLPEPARMVALAGGPKSWWAIGVAPGGISALPAPSTTRSTQPAAKTRPSTQVAATRPATRPNATSRLVLFSLVGNAWTPESELPGTVPDAPSVSLEFVDDHPYVADLIPGGVRIRHIEAKRWIIDAELKDLPPLAGFNLLANSPVPQLWVQPQNEPDQLYTLAKALHHIALPPIPKSTPATRALAFATGRLRMVAVVDGKWVEQDYNPDTGKPDGALAQLPIAQQSALAQLQWMRWIIVLAGLVLAMIGSYRQRAAMKDLAPKLEQITLAPLGKRLWAGIIDAIPIILAASAALARFHAMQIASEQTRDLLLLVIYWSAGIFYVLYLTVIETLAGRSLGKLLLGLRIVGLDGQPARTGALLMRNILRVIEVGLGFFPLALIVVFPLRQRAGDVAAGTLVVSGEAKNPPPKDGQP